MIQRIEVTLSKGDGWKARKYNGRWSTKIWVKALQKLVAVILYHITLIKVQVYFIGHITNQCLIAWNVIRLNLRPPHLFHYSSVLAPYEKSLGKLYNNSMHLIHRICQKLWKIINLIFRLWLHINISSLSELFWVRHSCLQSVAVFPSLSEPVINHSIAIYRFQVQPEWGLSMRQCWTSC